MDVYEEGLRGHKLQLYRFNVSLIAKKAANSLEICHWLTKQQTHAP